MTHNSNEDSLLIKLFFFLFSLIILFFDASPSMMCSMFVWFDSVHRQLSFAIACGGGQLHISIIFSYNNLNFVLVMIHSHALLCNSLRFWSYYCWECCRIFLLLLLFVDICKQFNVTFKLWIVPLEVIVVVVRLSIQIRHITIIITATIITLVRWWCYECCLGTQSPACACQHCWPYYCWPPVNSNYPTRFIWLPQTGIPGGHMKASQVWEIYFHFINIIPLLIWYTFMRKQHSTNTK